MTVQQPTREKRDVIQPTDETGISLAKSLIRSARFGAIAVIDPQDGGPLASRVGVATTIEGTPLILISGLSAHTQALVKDARCSLLLGEPGKGDPLAYPRISLICRARRLDRDSPEHAHAARRYLNRHPKAKLYVGLGDFYFFELAVERANLNGGFGKAYQLTRADLSAKGPHDELNDIEQAMIERLNSDDPQFLAEIGQVSGAKPSSWKVIGLDSEGIDLSDGAAVHRLNFPNQLEYVNDLHGTLAQLKRSVRS